MLKLHQTQSCPYCRRVRILLDLHNIPYVAINEPQLGSERRDMLRLPGVESAEVPVLEDGSTVIQGSAAILEYLEEHHVERFYGDPSWGYTRRLADRDFSQVLEQVKASLAEQGFGVLTQIDVKATFRKKLDRDFPDYHILGACHPNSAYTALQEEPGIGLLLPCNVVVARETDGTVVVSALNPVSVFGVLDRPALNQLSRDVGAALKKALAAL